MKSVLGLDSDIYLALDIDTGRHLISEILREVILEAGDFREIMWEKTWVGTL